MGGVFAQIPRIIVMDVIAWPLTAQRLRHDVR
jgi:hypothetical protein